MFLIEQASHGEQTSKWHSSMASALVLVSRFLTWAPALTSLYSKHFLPWVGFSQHFISATESKLEQKEKWSQMMNIQTLKGPPVSKTIDPHPIHWGLPHKKRERYYRVCNMLPCDCGWPSTNFPDTCHIHIWQVNQVPHTLSFVVTSPTREGGGVQMTGT